MRTDALRDVPSEAALVVPTLESGGAERVVLNLATGLRDAGVRVRIVAIDGRGPLRDHIPRGVELVDLERPRARRAVVALVTHLRRARTELLIGSQTHVNVLLALIRPFLRDPMHLVLREPALRTTAPRSSLGERVLGRLLGRADLVIASSEAMRERLELTVHGRAQVLTLPNPLDLAELRAVGDGAHRGGLIAVGRLVEGKAYDDLLRALAASPGSRQLTLVGTGPAERDLRQLAAELGIADRVEFVGHLTDRTRLATLVAAADLLVHPSRSEGMPNVVLEALALGTPVLATTELLALHELADEVGPSGLRLVPRDTLAGSIAETRPLAGPIPRPSLLPARFASGTVIAGLLEALAMLPHRAGA